MKTTNKQSRKYVQSKTVFQASNIFAETHNGNYVVYSYGYHWPMFANINGQWYENSDRYSVSTSKQQGQAHPLVDTIKVSVNELKSLIS
jgi:hypothetical protein